MVRPASHLQACVIAVLLFLLAVLVHAEPPAQSVTGDRSLSLSMSNPLP